MVVVIAITIVVMIVPVAFGVPAMAVFIPPSVVPAPAMLAGLMEFVAGAVRLSAVPAMMLNGFVEPVIGSGNATLAIIVIGKSARSSSQQQESAECGRQYNFSEQLVMSRQKRLHLIHASCVRSGIGVGGAVKSIEHADVPKVSHIDQDLYFVVFATVLGFLSATAQCARGMP
jgi:hypothetical protein